MNFVYMLYLMLLAGTVMATMNCDDKASLCQPCPNGGPSSTCEIQCGKVESCTGKLLDCSGAGMCTIQCLKERSCKGAIIKCPTSTTLSGGVTSGCILNCIGGDGSCQDAQVDNPVDDAELNCASNSLCNPYGDNCAGITVNSVVKTGPTPTPGGVDCTIKWVAVGLKISSPTWAEINTNLNAKLIQIRDTLKQSLVDAGRTETKVKLTYVCPLLPGGVKPTTSDPLSKSCIDPNQQFSTGRMITLLGADDGIYVETMLQGPSSGLAADEVTLEDTLRDASMGKGTLSNPADAPELTEIVPIAYTNGEYSLETQSQENDNMWSLARASDWSEPTPSDSATDLIPIILIAVGGCLLLVLIGVLVVIRGRSRKPNPNSESNQEMKVSDFLGGKNSACLESMEEAECVLTDYYRQNRGTSGRDAGLAAPMTSARVPNMRTQQTTGSVSRSSSESSDGQNRHSPTTGGNPSFTRHSGRGSSTRTVMSPPMRVRTFPQSTRRF
eukprot:TRINITY_DN22822_c0_g1_i1.p1 TRINITY_DN22822_c0_g1~~TRINITY_DN22822_c0_g1_i1.p1  ORF type:complete len:498 (+),score=73.95 TRINITY_DN22822_c0_g1_i1:85-1578(+)